jgi:hypothetical protein
MALGRSVAAVLLNTVSPNLYHTKHDIRMERKCEENNKVMSVYTVCFHVRILDIIYIMSLWFCFIVYFKNIVTIQISNAHFN